MDHLKIYIKIIDRAKDRNLDSGELHHIFPKSLKNNKKARDMFGFIGNVDSADNLVYLSLKEHFICHLLLPYIFRSNKGAYIKMLYAFNIMNNRGSGRNYSKLKEEYCRVHSEFLKGKPSRALGKKWSEESKNKRSQATKGKSYEELYGVEKANELKSLRAEKMRNRIITDEYREKLSNREITPEWRRKLSEARSGKFLSEEDRRIRFKDKTIYRFKNLDTGTIIEAKIEDMVIVHGCTSTGINGLLKHKVRRYGKWSLGE